jgi:chromosome segregation ATPase
MTISDRERTLATLLRELDGRASPALLRSALERAYDAGAAAVELDLGKQTGPALAEILDELGRLRAQVAGHGETMRQHLRESDEAIATQARSIEDLEEEIAGARAIRGLLLERVAELEQALSGLLAASPNPGHQPQVIGVEFSRAFMAAREALGSTGGEG